MGPSAMAPSTMAPSTMGPSTMAPSTMAPERVDGAEEGPAAADASKSLEELRNLFDSLDKDHDGKVTGKEWGKKVKENQTLLAKYFGGSTLKEIGSAFKRIDTDGNASLSWDEFVAAAGEGAGGGVRADDELSDASALTPSIFIGPASSNGPPPSGQRSLMESPPGQETIPEDPFQLWGPPDDDSEAGPAGNSPVSWKAGIADYADFESAAAAADTPEEKLLQTYLQLSKVLRSLESARVIDAPEARRGYR